jgi:hypothetical protein
MLLIQLFTLFTHAIPYNYPRHIFLRCKTNILKFTVLHIPAILNLPEVLNLLGGSL